MMKNTLLATLFIAWIIPSPKSPVKALELGGSAVVHGADCVRLTPDTPWVSGSAWSKKALELSEPFDLKMNLVFGSKDAWGADGIVFVLSSSPQTGWRGEGLGFGGLRNSLGIEFDTYQNGRQNDPEADHMALVTNGRVGHALDFGTVVELPNLEDGRPHALRVVWSPKKGQLQVHLDNKLRATYPATVLHRVFGPQASVHWGLTAGTGRKSNAHDVCFND